MRRPRKKKKETKRARGHKPFPYSHWIEWNQIDWKKYRMNEVPERVKGLWLIKLPGGSTREYFIPESDVKDLPTGTMVTRSDGTWYVIGATVAEIFSD